MQKNYMENLLKISYKYTQTIPRSRHQNLWYMINFENHWTRRRKTRKDGNLSVAVSGTSFFRMEVHVKPHIFAPIPNSRARGSDWSSVCAGVCFQTNRLRQREGVRVTLGTGDRWADVLGQVWTTFRKTLWKNMRRLFLTERWIFLPAGEF